MKNTEKFLWSSINHWASRPARDSGARSLTRLVVTVPCMRFPARSSQTHSIRTSLPQSSPQSTTFSGLVVTVTSIDQVVRSIHPWPRDPDLHAPLAGDCSTFSSEGVIGRDVQRWTNEDLWLWPPYSPGRISSGHSDTSCQWILRWATPLQLEARLLSWSMHILTYLLALAFKLRMALSMDHHTYLHSETLLNLKDHKWHIIERCYPIRLGRYVSWFSSPGQYFRSLPSSLVSIFYFIYVNRSFLFSDIP